MKEKFKMMYIPNWFNVDLKTGVSSGNKYVHDERKTLTNLRVCMIVLQYLTIHLGQEENDCFCAWVSGKDVGFVSPSDQKGNE